MLRVAGRVAAAATRRTGCAPSETKLAVLPRFFASLPEHIVVGMPALSPTMEVGNIAEWKKKEGDEIAAGDVICEVETDKATAAFEAQEEAFMAKRLVPEGAENIKVGDPIFVTVEDASFVAAFADFDVPADGAGAAALPLAADPAAQAIESAPISAQAVVASPAAAAAPAAVAGAPKASQTASPPAAAKAPAPATASATAPVPAPASTPSLASADEAIFAYKRWGTGVSGSALFGSLAKEQQAYVAKYGSTLQEPVKASG